MTGQNLDLARTWRRAGCAALLAAAALIAGCSSNAISTALQGSATDAAQVVPVLITDEPSDSLVSFSLTLNSIVLTDSGGKTASLLSTPTTIEVTHLNGVQEALVTASIPADTYTSARFTFSNPQVTYIDSTGKAVVATVTLAKTSYTDTFSTPITISNSSSSLLVDLIAAQSVTISGSTVTVSPVFSVKVVSSSTSTTATAKSNGGAMHESGTVVSASGTTLVIQPPSGSTVTFTTNSSTVFQNVSGLSALTAGELVEVDFTTQSSGTLLATRVELEPASTKASSSTSQANELEGPVTSVGSGSFQMTLTQAVGSSASSVTLGATYTVTTSSSTVFAVTPQFQVLSGLPFTPTFTAATLKAGQTVSVATSSISGTTAAATEVDLEPQTITGTVTAIATTGSYTAYTVTLASGSSLASLSGASTITVYTSSATTTSSSTQMTVGGTYRFNGLVFNDGGVLKMVAGVCPDGD